MLMLRKQRSVEKYYLKFGKNMSRIAKKPIAIPEKTTAEYSGGVLTIKGPLGELKKIFNSDIKITIENNTILLSPALEDIQNRALWGTYASHVRNMLEGVNKVAEKKLIVEGIGFKADIKGKEIHFALGFSHPIVKNIPDGLKVTSEKNIVTVSGIDREKVGQFVAEIRALKKPEPYKGKGIRYSDEVIRRKQGKKSV
jgi:large subunit ribosomal protein L6